MFSNVIRVEDTKILSTVADQYYGTKIPPCFFRGDGSFCATLRALFGDRLSDGESISVVTMMDQDAFDLDGVSPNTICIKRIPAGSEEEIIWDGFELKKDLGLLVEQSKLMNRCRIYVSEARRICFILCDVMNLKVWHALQSLTPRFMPWFFRDRRLTNDEKRLLFSLNKEVPNEYLEMLTEFTNKIDFRSISIRNIVGGMTERIANSKILHLQNEITNVRGRIASLMTEYREQCSVMDMLNIRLNGHIVQRNAHKSDDELLQFLNSQRWVEPIRSLDNGFAFVVSSYLDQFDPDLYESIAQNENSFLFDIDRPSQFRKKEDFLLLMNSIFGCEATLKVKCCAYFELDIRGSIETTRGFVFGPEYSNMIPNPHLQYHRCFGDHRPLIQDRINAGDMIGAIMQCKQSASSINVGESPTMCPFVKDLLVANKKCIHMPDGTDVTPAEALRILKEGQHA